MTLTDIVNKIETELPGFAWKVGTCCVSDDAWIVPDFNHPTLGPRLLKVFAGGDLSNIKKGDVWDEGVDIDRRPSGDPAAALETAFEEIVAAMKARQVWDAYRMEFHDGRAA